jgi:hypothetical protein
MSLSNTTVKASYQGDGSTANFAIPFTPIVDDSSETVVYIRDQSVVPATETLQSEGIGNDYTLTGAPTIYDFNTTVTFNAGSIPSATDVVVIVRQLPLTQTLDLTPSSTLMPTTLELHLDRAIAMIQQLGEILSRTIRLPITEQDADPVTATEPEADSVLVRNVTNTAFEWRLLSEFGATGPTGPTGPAGADGAGGGGGALQWVEAASSPMPTIENNAQSYLFQNALAQNLYADIRVPSTYTAGDQVNLRMAYYSPDTSGTVLLKTQATLIRSGTDAFTSTTNQRTSTNVAVTLSGAANLTRSVTFDLTSSIGQINSVNISANDLIRVRLYRDTDTATSDVRALVYGAEVSFG